MNHPYYGPLLGLTNGTHRNGTTISDSMVWRATENIWCDDNDNTLCDGWSLELCTYQAPCPDESTTKIWLQVKY